MLSSDRSSDSSSIVNLVACRTGSRRLVAIQGFPDFPESKQAAICARLDQLQETPAVDADALHARLQSLSSMPTVTTSPPLLPPPSPSTAPTTPPDPEEEMERDRLLEEQARKRLEQDGCPPCYPAGPSFLVGDPTEQYKKIISYWKAFPSSEGGELCAQWKDWQKFRCFQERNRLHYAQRGKFAQFINVVRERRRRHYLPEDVRMHSDPRQQSQLETWVEFLDYHLHTLEELEKRVHAEDENLGTTLKRSEGAVVSEAEHGETCVEAYRIRLASTTRKVKLHKELLLPWIEQVHIGMVAAQSATADDTGGHDYQIGTIRRTLVPGTRKRKLKVRSVVDPVRSAISKPAPRKCSLQSQPSEVSWKAGKSALDPRNSQSNTSWMPRLRATKPQRTRENAPLRPFRPQKVTKTVKGETKSKQRADINAHLRPSTQLRKTKGQNSAQRRKSSHSKSAHQHPSRAFTTQSGRVSRRPERPEFVSYW